MALITDAATARSAPLTLTTDEIWQARAGSVFVTTTASPATNDGLAATRVRRLAPAGSPRARFSPRPLPPPLRVRLKRRR